MNKFITYAKEHKFQTAIYVLGIIMFMYIVLFDLTIDFTATNNSDNSKTEFHYVAPFKI